MKSFIHVWLVVSLLPRIAISSDESSRLFSSIQCIGGSQILDTQSLSWAMRQGDQLSKFPMNDPEHRTCLLRNVCIDHGNLTYYITDFHHANIPIDYLPEGFNGRVTHLAHLRGFTMPIETVVGNIPKKHIWSEIPLTYLDANSWSFNYGHYLIDNVLPAFTAAKLFNLPFSDSQQIFETKCRLFTTLEESFSRRRVDFNKSMGTYQSVCLERLNGMGEYFFDHLPLYVDDIRSSALCFKKLMVGQGSSFGLKSVGKCVIFTSYVNLFVIMFYLLVLLSSLF